MTEPPADFARTLKLSILNRWNTHHDDGGHDSFVAGVVRLIAAQPDDVIALASLRAVGEALEEIERLRDSGQSVLSKLRAWPGD